MNGQGIRKWGFLFKDKNLIKYFEKLKIISDKKEGIKNFTKKENDKGVKLDVYI